MKSIILLTIGILISTLGISQQLIIEYDGANPVEIKTNSFKNVSFYNNSLGQKGYLGLFSGIHDMDFGTTIGNNVGNVNLTIEGDPRLTVLAGDSINVHENLIVNVADPISSQDAATKAYVDANTSAGGGPYAIGDFAHGGVVFWISPSEEHGKVVSIYDIGSTTWSNVTNTLVGTTAGSLINGAGNTVAIMMQTGHTSSAAQHCADLAYSGYDDWYLPSKDELNQVYNNRLLINTTAIAHGGDDFAEAIYWSSSEGNNFSAWFKNFFNGAEINIPKNQNFRVRAIRAF